MAMRKKGEPPNRKQTKPYARITVGSTKKPKPRKKNDPPNTTKTIRGSGTSANAKYYQRATLRVVPNPARKKKK